jgi:hypothetical protein
VAWPKRNDSKANESKRKELVWSERDSTSPSTSPATRVETRSVRRARTRLCPNPAPQPCTAVIGHPAHPIVRVGNSERTPPYRVPPTPMRTSTPATRVPPSPATPSSNPITNPRDATTPTCCQLSEGYPHPCDWGPLGPTPSFCQFPLFSTIDPLLGGCKSDTNLSIYCIIIYIYSVNPI